MNGKRGLVLFSGGIDSTITTLALAQRGNGLTALSINYVGRPNQEALTARHLANYLPFDDYREVTLSTGAKSLIILVGDTGSIPVSPTNIINDLAPVSE